MTRELLSIGAFARMCRLSVKRLRNYAELGLLCPAHVDPDSGYRYYTPDQAGAALTIALLRGCGVSLPVIAELLKGDAAQIRQVLSVEQARLSAEIDQRRRALHTVERMLDEGPYRGEVTVSREPARRLAVVRATCASEEMGAVAGACITRLRATLGEAFSPPVIGLFPLNLEPLVDIGVGVALAGDVPGADIDRLPEVSAATITHVGPYEELPLAYHGLFSWIREQGRAPCGRVVETYLADPSTVGPERLVTKVSIPLTEQ